MVCNRVVFLCSTHNLQEENKGFVMQIINTSQASNQLRTLLNVIQEGNTATVTRDSRSVAILLSPRDFQLLGGEEKLNQLRAESMQKNRKELKKAFNEKAFNDIREEAQANSLTQEILDDILNNV